MIKHVLAVLATAGLLAIAAPAVAAGPSTSASPAEVFVAPNGEDTASGTIDHPVRSLEGARDVVRTMKSHGDVPSAGVIVNLREGTYQRSSTFELDARDSGAADAPITYRSYPGETARLTGGRELDSAKFHTVTDSNVLGRIIDPAARGKVRAYDLKANGIDDYGQLSRHGFSKANSVSKTPPMELYVGGGAMTLARWPNASTVRMGKIVDPGPTSHDADLQERGGTFAYDDDRPQLWSHADDIWLDGIFGNSWEWSFNKVDHIDTSAHTITLRYGEMSGLKKTWYDDFHFATNLLEELDAPGEYYIDRTAGILYLIPNDAFAHGAAATVTTLDSPMIRTQGTSNVTFDNLILQYGRADAAVILGGDHVTIEHSDIKNFTDGGILINAPGRYGHAGTTVDRTGHDHAVISTDVSHIGGQGVELGGGDAATLTPGRNKVENSHIHDFAYYNKVYQPGVLISGVGNIIRGNEINDAPHPGIIVHGNDHIIEDNEIYDVCKTFQDLGAIYMNAGSVPQERGTAISHNYFHDIGMGRAGVEGIYLDNLTMGVTMTKNIFSRMGNNAIKVAAGDHNTATNNLFVDTRVPFNLDNMWMGDQPGNTVDTSYMPTWKALFKSHHDFAGTKYLTEYPELATFFDENHHYPSHNSFEHNVTWNPTVTRTNRTNAQGALDAENLVNYKANVVLESDPGFTDAEHGDFQPKSGFSVPVAGFEPIDTHTISTHGDVGFHVAVIKPTTVVADNPRVTMHPGDTTTLHATVRPARASDATLEWASSDLQIATVDETGTVHAIHEGSTTIRIVAKANHAAATEVAIDVHAAPAPTPDPTVLPVPDPTVSPIPDPTVAPAPARPAPAPAKSATPTKPSAATNKASETSKGTASAPVKQQPEASAAANGTAPHEKAPTKDTGNKNDATANQTQHTAQPSPTPTAAASGANHATEQDAATMSPVLLTLAALGTVTAAAVVLFIIGYRKRKSEED